MRKLLAVLALVPGFAVATPVTYEFTASLGYSYPDTDSPMEYAHGYITFDGDALMTTYREGVSDSGQIVTRTAQYESLVLSLAVVFGDDFLYSAGPGGGGFQVDYQGGIGAGNSDWYFSAGAQAIDGRYFSMLFERRCEFETCPYQIGDILDDDLMEIDNVIRGWKTFTVKDTPGYTLGDPRIIYDFTSFNRVEVPEPGTLALFGLGLLGVALTRRSRKPEQSPCG